MADIRIARTVDDLTKVFTIRAAVYMAGQDCPYAEEFDGNDLCATHFIGFVGDEPVGCLRVRFFADFVKFERLAVRSGFRQASIAFDMVYTAVEHIRRKGYVRIYGHSQEGVEDFWAKFGAKRIGEKNAFSFSGHKYTEMLSIHPTHPDPISLNSGPMVILRPEGDWDRPGVLELRMPDLISQP